MGCTLGKRQGGARAGDPLAECTYDNTREYVPTFDAGARFLRAYDGDTVHLCTLVDGAPHRFSCRLYGIDTAEMRTTDPHEKMEAQAAKRRLVELLLGAGTTAEAGRLLRVTGVMGRDKYGRVLVRLATADGEDAADVLVREGLAVRYDGRAKRHAQDPHFWRKRREERVASGK